MKNPLSALVLVLVAVSACAPTPPASAPAPAPTAAPAPAPAPVATDTAERRPPAPEPDVTLDKADERWWHLHEPTDLFPGTSADLAYREVLAGRTPRQTVVVAILDSGVDVEHEDLDEVIWTNPGEVPGNGIDDDRNGYVDDVNGWNFIGGPDGAQVEHDTYELTRLYAALRHYEGADPDTLSAQQRAEHARFRELADEFRSEVAKARQELEQIRRIDQVVDRYVGILQTELQTDSLTAEAVQELRSFRPEVLQARQVYLNLVEQGITPEIIDEQLEYMENKLRYGLDPDFDPRPIVGDDYGDPTERFYGNPLVVGPDAEHGTHVAGIVGAERGNGLGIDGIASAVEIMVVRVVPNGDERDKDVANAIRYAVDNGAHIVNMSFGKAHSPRKDVVDAAVKYAEERGVLLVHAAGNDAADVGETPSFPNRDYADGGRASNWIEVGASSWRAPDRIVADFSNYNRERVDVFAPGHDIYSTVPGNAYKTNSGTSMAAPVVSGLAALILAYHPDLTPEQVRRIIMESATRYPGRVVALPGGEDEMVPFEVLSISGGIVNADAALRLAAEVDGNR